MNTHARPLDAKSGLGSESQVEEANDILMEHSRGDTDSTDASIGSEEIGHGRWRRTHCATGHFRLPVCVRSPGKDSHLCRFVGKCKFFLGDVGFLDSRSVAVNSLHGRLLGLHPDGGWFRAGTVRSCGWTMMTTAALRLRNMIKGTQVPYGPQLCMTLLPSGQIPGLQRS